MSAPFPPFDPAPLRFTWMVLAILRNEPHRVHRVVDDGGFLTRALAVNAMRMFLSSANVEPDWLATRRIAAEFAYAAEEWRMAPICEVPPDQPLYLTFGADGSRFTSVVYPYISTDPRLGLWQVADRIQVYVTADVVVPELA